MSTQSIKNKTIHSFKQDLLNRTKVNAEKLIFNKVYALGEGYCEFEQADTTYLLDIIGMNNNSLNCIIEQLLRGEDVSKECDKELPQSLAGDYQNNQPTKSQNSTHNEEHIRFNTLPALPEL